MVLFARMLAPRTDASPWGGPAAKLLRWFSVATEGKTTQLLRRAASSKSGTRRKRNRTVHRTELPLIGERATPANSSHPFPRGRGWGMGIISL